MIITSRAIRARFHAQHLLNTANNEAIETLAGFNRHVGTDVGEAIKDMAAISRSNPQCKRELFSFAVSPVKAMTDDDLRAVLAIIEAEHGIPESTPRLVVRHAKGSRANHFHVVYSLVDPISGRAIKTQRKQFQDELASRRSELLLGEEIVPGANHPEVIAVLSTRPEWQGQSIKLESKAPDRWAHVSPSARQQAKRLGADAPAIMIAAFRAFQTAKGDNRQFIRALEECGIFIGAGRKAAMLVDENSGFTHSLARAIRIGAKIEGESAAIRERDLARMLGSLEPFEIVEERCRQVAEGRGTRSIDHQFRQLKEEAELDDDKDALAWLAERKRRFEAQLAEAFKSTLKARRDRIRASHKRADEISRKRVDRAFLAARIFDSPDLRKIAFVATACGVVLAGGGLGLALLMGGIAVGAMPSRERARALALDEKLSRRNQRTIRDLELAQSYGRLRGEMRQTRTRQVLPRVKIQDRAAVAKYVRSLVRTLTDPADDEAVRQVEMYRAKLGPERAEVLAKLVREGDGRIALLLHRAGRRPVYVNRPLPIAEMDRATSKAQLDLKLWNRMRIVDIRRTDLPTQTSTPRGSGGDRVGDSGDDGAPLSVEKGGRRSRNARPTRPGGGNAKNPPRQPHAQRRNGRDRDGFSR